MKNIDPRQLELFSDGARAVAAHKRPKPPKRTEADLQAKLEAARMRVREIVLLRMKFWLPQETRDGLRDAEYWRRARVRFHYRFWRTFEPGEFKTWSIAY
jgi:hypothetical protein